MRKKLSKENIILFLIILASTILLANAFLKPHFSSDTYVLFDLGYMIYPSHYFLRDGRIISAIICYLAGFLKIPYNAYIVGMDFIAVCLLSITIFIFYKKIVEIIGAEEKLHQLLILLASYLLIFNQCTLEYLLFPESAVMCFSLLCVVLAAINTISNNKKKWYNVCLLLLMVVISYQGLITAFPILVFFLQFLNLKYIEKKNINTIIKNLIISSVILLLITALGISLIAISNKILNKDFDRLVIRFFDFEIISALLKIALKRSFLLFFNFLNMLPKMFLPIISIISIIFMSIEEKSRKYIVQIIIIICLILIENCIFMAVFNTGETGRANWITSLVWGISLIYLLVNFDKDKIFGKTITVFVVASFLFNSFMLIQNSSYHTAANIIDKNDGYTINTRIKKYEEETNNKITKFSYMYDKNSTKCAPGIRRLGSLTERALSCPWSINQSLNYYTGRKLELVEFPEDLAKSVEYMDYDGFSEEQLIFEKDTLYILVY